MKKAISSTLVLIMMIAVMAVPTAAVTMPSRAAAAEQAKARLQSESVWADRWSRRQALLELRIQILEKQSAIYAQLGENLRLRQDLAAKLAENRGTLSAEIRAFLREKQQQIQKIQEELREGQEELAKLRKELRHLKPAKDFDRIKEISQEMLRLLDQRLSRLQAIGGLLEAMLEADWGRNP